MIILDTNVCSELIRPEPAESVLDWFSIQAPGELYVSAISEAELRLGVNILPGDARRDALLDAIEGMLREDFGGRILSFGSSAAREYAEIAARRRAVGRPISHPDCQIAGTARSLGAAVATRDLGGFEGCGIEVICPWEYR